MIRFFCLSLITISLSLSLSLPRARASSCCGGSVAAPALISGDERAQASLSYSQLAISDDVYPDGRWSARGEKEILETWSAEGAHIFKDRYQAGVSIPVVRRRRLGESAAGLGDMTANLGYEYLPDWDYNPWRPRGLGFIQVSAPTGTAVFESRNDLQLDTTGRGFWSLGTGTLLTKFRGRWDWLGTLVVRRSFPRVGLTPGWGGSLGGGFGYSLGAWRLGGGVTWIYEDPVRRDGELGSKGSAQRWATATASLSFMPDDNWAASLSYQDQTLIGSPVNTNLGRGLWLHLQRRWSR